MFPGRNFSALHDASRPNGVFPLLTDLFTFPMLINMMNATSRKGETYAINYLQIGWI
jgi:hypothetical protein